MALEQKLWVRIEPLVGVTLEPNSVWAAMQIEVSAVSREMWAG